MRKKAEGRQSERVGCRVKTRKEEESVSIRKYDQTST